MSEQFETDHQKNCPHQDSSGQWTINISNGYPDRQPRGICIRCQLVIHPRHWTSAGPNETVLVNAHPLYAIVMKLSGAYDTPSVMRSLLPNPPPTNDLRLISTARPTIYVRIRQAVQLFFDRRRKTTLRKARTKAEEIIGPTTYPEEIMKNYKAEVIRRYGLKRAATLGATPDIWSVGYRARFNYFKMRLRHMLGTK